uniref:6-phosphogluconate dehydrogenase NADP-binding domain-containing protein n=1 Tax=Bionectria ochroleuca TaxID=29856 RepID=A0A8H7NCA8_BIOOC
MASSTSPRIGWIGLGSMGLGMASNLQKHLSKSADIPQLTYHNRTMSRGEPLQALGASPSETIRDLVANTDIIFISLSDDAALSQTLDSLLAEGAAEHLHAKVIVDTSTVHPDSSVKARDRLAAKDALFVAAPVFGASPVAAEGKLLWIMAGPKIAVEAVTPYILDIMGRKIIQMGEDVRQSSLLKTAGNFVTAAMMEVVAEAHVFAEKTGLGDDAMSALFEFQYGPLAHSMSRRLTSGAYIPAPGERPWSDLRLALKDVAHGVRCAEDAGARLHVGELALKHLQEASREERPLDSSSLYGVLRRQAGLDFESDFVKERDGAQ